MSSILFQLFCLVAYFLCANAQLSTCLTALTLPNLELYNAGSLKEMLIIAELQNELNSGKSICDCPTIRGLLVSATDSYDVYYGENLRKLCECDEFVWPVGFAEYNQNKIQRAESLKFITGAILAADALQLPLSEEIKSHAVENIRKLIAPDATFRNTFEENGSVENTQEVLKVLAILSNFQPAKSFWSDIQDKVLELIPDGAGSSIADPTLVAVLNGMSDKKPRLSAPRLLAVAEQLLSLVIHADLNIVTPALKSLKVISTYKAAPLYLSFSVSEFLMDESHKLQLQVLDVLGNPLTVSSAEVLSLKNAGKDETLSEGRQFEGGVFDFSADKLSAGRYLLQLAVSVEGRAKPIPYQSFFTILDKVELSDVFAGAVQVFHASNSQLVSVSASKIAEFVASASDADHVAVHFALTRPSVASQREDRLKKPQQSFVNFRNTQAGTSVTYVAKMLEGSSDSKLQFTVNIALADEVTRFSHLSGLYEVTILVADAAYQSPLSLLVGKVYLKFPPQQVSNLPLYSKSLLHASDTTLSALPEITHVMRPPAKQASGFMSTVFTGATLTLLLAFVGFLVSLRPGLRRMSSLSSVVLALALALTLLLYVGYWLALDGISFYQTIKYLCFIFPATVVIGRYALSAVSETRLSSLDSKSK